MRRLAIFTLLLLLPTTAPTTRDTSPDVRYAIGELLHADDFSALARWTPELEKPGTVELKNNTLTLDVPAGLTLWFNPKLVGPIMISFDVTQISAGGSNDRVSDTNLFWMATDARSPDNLFAAKRTGAFKDYDALQCYYAGIGGNANTTTRFRRYVGQPGNRPLLPEHDLTAREHLLEPNRTYRVRAVACGQLIQLWRDDTKLFEFTDSNPYTAGHFALRTVTSHQRIQNFRVHRLLPTEK